MRGNKKRKELQIILRWLGWVLLIQFVLINISASLYAYKLTHLYVPNNKPFQKTASENIVEKTWRLFAGPRIYKSIETETPAVAYTTVRLQANKNLELDAWHIKTDSLVKGTVILFHGLTGNKSYLLQVSNEFRYWGYNVFLIDARAHGKSGGSYTTIGYKEAEDVKCAYDYISAQGEKNILLWGGSMGAVQIIKAMSDYDLKPAAIMLEMPFASLQSFLKGRAKTLGFPSQPFAFLTTMWMSIERGMNGFEFNAVQYAKQVSCPVLLQCGDRDHFISMKENKALYDAMPAISKKMVVYTNTGHESFLQKDTGRWREETAGFLKMYVPNK